MGSLGALILFFFFVMPLFLIGLVAASVDSGGGPQLPKEVVLQVDLRMPMTDQPQYSAFDFSGRPSPSVVGLIEIHTCEQYSIHDTSYTMHTCLM